MPEAPKISLHIFAIPPWHGGNKADFLPADKHKCFLQDGSITLGVISQTGTKNRYQSTKNSQFTISLQYLKENMKEEVDFFPVDKC